MIQPELRNIERQKQFITNASHELKTPLAVIRANTELIELMEGENEWTTSTLRQVDRMNGLIKNLVTIARAEEKADKSALAEVDVSAAVQDTVNTFTPVASQDGKEMVGEIEANVRLVTETYNCPDPYAVTEMEDNALAVALDHIGMLDRFLIIRCSVDMDVFMNDSTPETLWGGQEAENLAEEESADIFETAMHNNFKVGSQVIDAILEGKLS